MPDQEKVQRQIRLARAVMLVCDRPSQVVRSSGKIKLFQCKASAFCDESLVSMPGFSHRSQPFKEQVYWYPFEEWKVTVWLFARHRRHACKQLEQACVAARGLDEGRSSHNIPQYVVEAFNERSKP